MKIMLENVRLSFPALFSPESVMGGHLKYRASFLIDPDKQSELVAKVFNAMKQVSAEKWPSDTPEQAKKRIATMYRKDTTCLHDGEQKAQYDGYSGMLYVTANSPTRPMVINRDRSPLEEADGIPYGGCYVNVLLDIWTQDKYGTPRINASLEGVQFVKDGDSFGGSARTASPEDFQDLGANEGSPFGDLVDDGPPSRNTGGPLADIMGDDREEDLPF